MINHENIEYIYIFLEKYEFDLKRNVQEQVYHPT